MSQQQRPPPPAYSAPPLVAGQGGSGGHNRAPPPYGAPGAITLARQQAHVGGIEAGMSRVKVSSVEDAKIMMELGREIVMDDASRSRPLALPAGPHPDLHWRLGSTPLLSSLHVYSSLRKLPPPSSLATAHER